MFLKSKDFIITSFFLKIKQFHTCTSWIVIVSICWYSFWIISFIRFPLIIHNPCILTQSSTRIENQLVNIASTSLTFFKCGDPFSKDCSSIFSEFKELLLSAKPEVLVRAWLSLTLVSSCSLHLNLFLLDHKHGCWLPSGLHASVDVGEEQLQWALHFF